MKIKKELYKAKKYDIVSFDIFDTLIERNVEKPTDIFFQVGVGCFSNYEMAMDFQKRRIIAEHIARNISKTGEVNLDDIYNALEGYDFETCKKLKNEEIHTEINSCYPRSQIVELFNELKNMGVPLVLISDMYLPKNCLIKILTKCGIDGYKALFVSNEYGCDKISGDLFKIVHKEWRIKDVAHLHYGDSIKADILGARKAKVTPCLVLKRNWFKLFINKLYESIGSKCR